MYIKNLDCLINIYLSIIYIRKENLQLKHENVYSNNMKTLTLKIVLTHFLKYVKMFVSLRTGGFKNENVLY